MAADTPLVTAEDFTDEEWATLEKAASGTDPRKFFRDAVLALAEQMVAGGIVADNEDESLNEDPAEAGQEPVEGQGEVWVPLAGPEEAAILERLDRLERGMREVKIWAKTVLSELYAHTGYPSEAVRKNAQAAAMLKFAEIEKSVAAELGRGGSSLN